MRCRSFGTGGGCVASGVGHHPGSPDNAPHPRCFRIPIFGRRWARCQRRQCHGTSQHSSRSPTGYARPGSDEDLQVPVQHPEQSRGPTAREQARSGSGSTRRREDEDQIEPVQRLTRQLADLAVRFCGPGTLVGFATNALPIRAVLAPSPCRAHLFTGSHRSLRATHGKSLVPCWGCEVNQGLGARCVGAIMRT
jgi:hypothetical protein